VARFWQRIWLILKTIQARLRFVLIMLAIGGVIAYWDTLQGFYEKWTRLKTQEIAANSDTEYFCPMHPQVIRDHSDQCPICFMPLSRRKKGGALEPLPAGTVSRVQFSPYRVVLAGARTSTLDYRALVKEIRTVGFVEFDERKLARISSRLSGRSRIDKLYVNVTGQTVIRGEPLALLYSPDLIVTVQSLLDAHVSKNSDQERIARERLNLWGIESDQIDEILRTGKAVTRLTIRSPISGHVIRKYQIEGEYVDEGARLYDVADLSTVWIEAQVYEEDLASLREGMSASATTPALPNQELVGKIAFLNPHLDQNTRTLTVRLDVENNPNHQLRPGMFATVKLFVPANQLNLLPGNATPDQKSAFEQGRVLAVPETSVIDTGSHKIVYRQQKPGVFDGIEVVLGPRMVDAQGNTFFPVLKGASAGDQIVTSGSFLIDAETRLNPAAGSIYFGGTGGNREPTLVRPSTPSVGDNDIEVGLAKLTAEDRLQAEAQKYCPIQQDNRLGIMGKPFRILIQDRPVFLCCKGCAKEAQASPKETLAKVDALVARNPKRGR
jgi:multidrug efflux pump subunit AcrA (membrane-fusion protein)